MVNSNLTNSPDIVSGSKATNLVFIDTSVADFSSLLAGLKPNTEAIVLDPTADGISQITNFLSQRTGVVDSIQILGHGAAGSLQLGITSLSVDNLEQYQAALSKWFTPQLGKTPDLLIYGCDVASGEIGENFIQKLSQITGADVAASVDLTGSAAKGGNWVLEKATGVIEAGQAFTKKVRDAYQDVLATFTVTNNNDSGAGSLRQAIIDANATGAADNILFNIGAGGVQTIKLLTPLPIINTQINLDGTTQPGANGKPAIELRGDGIPEFSDTNSANFTNGLTFWNGSNNSVAKGFIVNRFQGNGIKVGNGNNYNIAANGPSGVTIENNYIGTDISGTVGLGNSWWGDPEVANGLYIHKSPNTTVRNNLISGNTTSAVVIREGSTGLMIDGNKIGTDVTGSLPLGSQRWSVYINNGSNGILQNNLIAASGYDYENSGMEMLETYGTNMTITGNTLGTDITKTKSFRNRGHYQAPELYPGGVPIVARLYGSDTVSNNTYVGTWPLLNNGNTALNLPLPPQPILNTIAPSLGTIANNITPAANQGSLLSNLVNGSITNPDGSQDKGIAITQVNNTNGTWEYSTDNGSNWQDLATALVSKYRPQSNANYPGGFNPAFLLATDNKNRIRFVPNSGFVGTVSNGVIYKGWNERTGGNGIVLNISPYGRPNVSPLLNSLSANNDGFSVDVTGTNAAPVLDPSLVKSVDKIPVDPVTNPGTLITDILSNASSDPDPGALKGIAITSVDNSNGTWEYALNGTNWQPIGTPSPALARLLAADVDTKIRFVPNNGYTGTPNISFRAWDRSSGGAEGSTADVTTNGGITAFSADVATSKISVGVIINQDPAIVPEPTFSVPLEVLRLLKNPDAPPTPAPVVVGEAPLNNTDSLNNPDIKSGESSTDGNTPQVVGNSGNATGNEDCPCEAIIKQQKPNPVTDTIQGTKGEDVLVSTPAANTVYGLQSNDTILGTPNPDNLYGGQGQDLIRGFKKRDFIQGGGGDDTLYGGRGRDVVKGGRGDDTIYGGKKADFLSGGLGNDTIYGGRGNDFISGGKGRDRLFGGGGKDNLCGCAGADFIRGGKGNDILDGEKGNDILVGGLGNDTLTGGAGRDRFRFAPNKGTDTITDFTVGEDLIELVKGLKLSDLQITQGIGATVIGFQPSSQFASDKPLVVLTGVNAATLTPNSFLVV